MARAREVVIDTSHLTRDTRQLTAGLTAGGLTASYNQAVQTAGKLSGLVPVRTGALRSTVAAVAVTGGYGVTYGSGQVYHYVQNARLKIVKRGTRGSRAAFYRALQAVAEREVGRV